MHANGDIERGYPPVLPLASRGALVGATPLLVTGTPRNSYPSTFYSVLREKFLRTLREAVPAMRERTSRDISILT